MPEQSARTQLRVGRLSRAHGLKGGLKIELYTDEPLRRFVPGATFSLQVPTSSRWHGKSLELVELKVLNSNPVGFFVGVNDRSDAETLVKAVLWVEQDARELPPEPDAWYQHQLAGLAVVRDGVEIGLVARVESMPAQDLLVVRVGEAEVLLPFVTAFVPEVDLRKGRIVITPPGGLFEDLGEPTTPVEPAAEPTQVEPAAESTQVEPADAKTSAEPMQAEPTTQVEPAAESTQVEPTQVEPADD